MTEEERMATLFGGDKNKYTADKLQGSAQETSRFISRSHDYYQIGSIKIPYKPIEPDNCCMSGCVNCVWLMYQDDLQNWKHQRRIAAKEINKTDEVWPENLKPPIHLLNERNIPKSMKKLKEKASKKRRLSTFQFPPQLNQTELEKQAAEQEAREADEAAAETEAEEDVTPEFIKQFTRFEKQKAAEKLHKLQERQLHPDTSSPVQQQQQQQQ